MAATILICFVLNTLNAANTVAIIATYLQFLVLLGDQHWQELHTIRRITLRNGVFVEETILGWSQNILVRPSLSLERPFNNLAPRLALAMPLSYGGPLSFFQQGGGW
jgi:hypothetical protein